MARVCVDASAVIAWLVPEQRSPLVRQTWVDLQRNEDAIYAPPLLYAECTSVLRGQVGSALTHHETIELVGELFELPISQRHERGVYVRALELAEQFGRRRAYDMQYLAVAELEGAELLTLDGGLFEAASQLGVPTRFLR